MLIDIVSDIHLRTPYDLGDHFYTANAPVLAVLGDVCEADQIEKMMPVFKRMNRTWERVLYVLGNHEFYKGCLDSTPDRIRDVLSRYKNIHVLDNDVVTLGDTTFIGTTLWSDMDRNNPITKQVCKTGISDYYYIFPSQKEMSFHSLAIKPDDTVSRFNINTAFIDEMLWLFTQSKKIAMLTHHAPSYQSIVPRFKTSPYNGAFASNLEHIMVDNEKIKLWAHGHCHSELEYSVNQCKVVCHPKGYIGEIYGHSHDYIPLTVEI